MCQGNGERQLLTFAFYRVKIENVEKQRRFAVIIAKRLFILSAVIKSVR